MRKREISTVLMYTYSWLRIHVNSPLALAPWLIWARNSAVPRDSIRSLLCLLDGKVQAEDITTGDGFYSHGQCNSFCLASAVNYPARGASKVRTLLPKCNAQPNCTTKLYTAAKTLEQNYSAIDTLVSQLQCCSVLCSNFHLRACVCVHCVCLSPTNYNDVVSGLSAFVTVVGTSTSWHCRIWRYLNFIHSNGVCTRQAHRTVSQRYTYVTYRSTGIGYSYKCGWLGLRRCRGTRYQ